MLHIREETTRSPRFLCCLRARAAASDPGETAPSWSSADATASTLRDDHTFGTRHPRPTHSLSTLRSRDRSRTTQDSLPATRIAGWPVLLHHQAAQEGFSDSVPHIASSFSRLCLAHRVLASLRENSDRALRRSAEVSGQTLRAAQSRSGVTNAHQPSGMRPRRQWIVFARSGEDPHARAGCARVPSRSPSFAGQRGVSPGPIECRPLCHAPITNV
jgi:hypothetical protein